MSKTVIAYYDVCTLRHTLNLKDTAYIIYASLESYYKIMYIIVGRGGQIPRGVNGNGAALASLTRVQCQTGIHNDDDLHVKGPATFSANHHIPTTRSRWRINLQRHRAPVQLQVF